MDLYRRIAAGRLAEILGPSALPNDIALRRHRFESVADAILTRMPHHQRAMLESYSEGVNAGLDALRIPHPEYLLLRIRPEEWSPRDTVLVSLFMHLGLSRIGDNELDSAQLEQVLPPEVIEFLTPIATRFCALPDGSATDYTPMPVPDSSLFDARRTVPHPDAGSRGHKQETVRGSNSWAVAGSRTAHAGAILANDMHLGLSVPNVWSRIQLEWVDEQGSPRRAVGISLPGAPGLIVGSNGYIAWGFTNVTGDFIDHVVIEHPDGDASHYLTPEGPEPFSEHTEVIRVRGSEDVRYTWRDTRWGLISSKDHRGRDLVEVWIAHDAMRCNLAILDMLNATTIEESVDIARSWYGPPQNVLMASVDGRIAWVLAGWIPNRIGFDGSVPVSWSTPDVGWSGPLPEDQRPVIIDPESGILFTANARTLPIEAAREIGRDFALGVRQQSIGQLLQRQELHDELSLLNIALDYRSPLHDFYAELMRKYTRNATDAHLMTLHSMADSWIGNASADSAEYLVIRTFRSQIHRLISAPIESSVTEDHADYKYNWYAAEETVRRILEDRPLHWLDPRFTSWCDLIAEALRQTVQTIESRYPDTKLLTPWGIANHLYMEHPYAEFTGGIISGFDIPPSPQSGDAHTIRVARNSFGASQRLVVSPGKEESAILHVPAGITPHPLSPYRTAGHKDWLLGTPSPLLAGKPRHRLLLIPESTRGTTSSSYRE